MRIKGNLLIAIVSIGFVTPSIYAAESTSTFTVRATVASACTISANTLEFGSYDPVSAQDLDQTTTLNVTCTSGTPYTVGLDIGQGAGATVASRKMTSGVNTINYSLYQGVDRTTVWGDTIGTNTMAGTGTGLPQTLTVYGRVFSGQNAVPAGTYEDTIEATVTY